MATDSMLDRALSKRVCVVTDFMNELFNEVFSDFYNGFSIFIVCVGVVGWGREDDDRRRRGGVLRISAVQCSAVRCCAVRHYTALKY